MFFALSFAPHKEEASVQPAEIAEQRAVVEAAQQTVNELRADNAQPQAIQAAQMIVDQRREQLVKLEAEMRDGRADGLKPGSWQASLKDMATGDAQDGQPHAKATVMGQAVKAEGHGLGATIAKKLQNPDLALYKLQQTLYKFAFLLVPLSIPFVALLFLWRRGFTLYDHGVFVLYSLTFMAMLLMLMVVSASLAGWLGGIVIPVGLLAVPVHMFAQMKGAYSLGVFSALWRTTALLVFCNIVIGLFVTAIIYLGLGH